MQMQNPEWVFAYGSNMSLNHLRGWLRRRGVQGRILRHEPAVLEGHELVWDYYSNSRRSGAANIRPQPGSVVHGLAILVEPAVLRGIDTKEGHSDQRFYVRGPNPKNVQLLLSGQTVSTWVYISSNRQKRPQWPRRGYRNLLVRAARRYGFPERYINFLEQTPTCN